VSYIELHEHVWNHPKTIELSGRLQVRKTYAVAHLSRLWTWCIRYAEDGCITNISPFILADAADWGGDPEHFLQALVDSKYVDKTPEGVFIHDWDDYAGKLLEFRKRDRERKRKPIGTRQHSDGNPMEIQRNSIGQKVDSSSIAYTQKPIPNTQNPIPKTQEEEGVHAKACTRDRTDYNGIMDAFNKICTSLPSVQKMTDERKRRVKAWGASVEEARVLFERVQASDFLSGRVKDFTASFDWITKPTNRQKILEGQYDNKGTRTGGGMAVFDEAERILRERGSLA